MPVFHGIFLEPAPRLAAEKFENEMMIGKKYRFILPGISFDMEGTLRAVAIACNPSRNGGLQGRDTGI